MPGHCSPTFARLAGELGFSCRTEGGLVAFRNPFDLENWTLPVLEATVILGAALSLVYAVSRLRRHGDPTNLVVWLGSTAYLLIIEPPLYFPAAYGISGHVDTMFAHNVFTVDFLWGRLPLYIVATYPFMATLAFETVRMLGVFRRYGVLAGAVCVGFVGQAYYEIFDQIGPQLRWWEWSTGNPLNQPMFDSVPLSSVVVFAALWPMSLAIFVQLLVGRHIDAGRRFSGPQLAWRAAAAGILGSAGTFVLPLPATAFGAHNITVRGALYAAELIVLSLVAVPVLLRQWQRARHDDSAAPRYSNDLILVYGVVYLGVMTLFWATALPDFLHATHGWARNGGPTGNLPYTLACFALATLCAAAVLTTPRERTATRPDGTPEVTAAGHRPGEGRRAGRVLPPEGRPSPRQLE